VEGKRFFLVLHLLNLGYNNDLYGFNESVSETNGSKSCGSRESKGWLGEDNPDDATRGDLGQAWYKGAGRRCRFPRNRHAVEGIVPEYLFFEALELTIQRL
jgi:hypothetical protein